MKAVFPYSLRLFVIFSEKDEVKIQIVKHSFKDGNWYYSFMGYTKLKSIKYSV
jgi:hypothetical protein